MESIHSKKNMQDSKKKLFMWSGFFVVIIIIILLVRYFSLFWGLTIDRDVDVKQTKEGGTSILLMGKGGGSHEGPDLTDTIMLASLNPEKNTVDLISIPRDLYIKSMGSKINAAYIKGEKEKKGMIYAKAIVASVTGIKPDYAVVIDFSGFEKLIDLLGGIDVNVDNTLIDSAYPTEGKERELCGVTEDGLASFSAQIATSSATESDIFPCRFEVLRIEEGKQHMKGGLALKFVRSRHALGNEGSDFARSKRQQSVINAIREKVLSLGTLANPLKVVGIIGILKDNIATDIQENEYDDFIKLAQKMKGAKITSHVLDTGDVSDERYGLLINPPLDESVGFQWVLSPRAGVGDYSEIKEYVLCVLEGKECEITETDVRVIASPTSVQTKTP